MKNSVQLFKDTNFRGKSETVYIGESSRMPSRIGNDNLSSIKVGEGVYIRLYEHTGFRGKEIVLFQGDYNSLPGWNDKISSYKIIKHNPKIFPLVEFFEHTNFQGYNQRLAGTGKVTEFDQPFFRNDDISSLKVPAGVTVTLYEHTGFRGDSLQFNGGDNGQTFAHLGDYGWNDKVSSVKILLHDLTLTHIEYLGIEVDDKGPPRAIPSRVINDTPLPQESEIRLSEAVTESAERDWSNSTLIGMEYSVKGKVGISTGPVTAEVEKTITGTLQNTTTVGESESHSRTYTHEIKEHFVIPEKSVGEISCTFTPMKYKIRARYTYRVGVTRKKIKQDLKIFVSNAHVGEVKKTTFPIASASAASSEGKTE